MRRFGFGWVLASVALAACIANAPEGLQRQTDADGGGGESFGNANQSSSSSGVTTGPNTSDPHAVLATDPPHGPFTGGQRVIVSGKGFAPDVRVWFGETEAQDVIAIDPATLQATAPPGQPGEVDVITQNGDDDSTRRSLVAGYTYDALYASPDQGPVAGGTVISIFGTGTTWDQDVEEARIDQKPCTTLDVMGPTELRCTVPKGTPGAKSVSVITANDTTTALDAYTYSDSEDGFKGGLGGDPLAGKLRVLVYDNLTGDPVGAAHVVVGANALYEQTDGTGVVEITDPILDNPATVTITAECHSPITFVDVPVDTVTVYLDPVLTPQCAGDGDPPPGGGNPVLTGLVTGELIWPSTQEFQKGPWSNVPPAGANEQRIAFLYFATSNRGAQFSLPSTTFSVEEDDPGNLGYGFTITSTPGNRTMYALAGLQKTTTKQFTAYAFGAVDGVAVFPGAETEQVFIDMDHALDQALTMTPSPPAPGPKGPDRLDARVVVELSQRNYAILPGMQKTPFIPLSGSLNFIGLPGLDGSLTGTRYIASAAAVTGPSLGAPLSRVSAVATTTTSVPADVSGFVAIPTLADPPSGGGWNGQNLAASYASGGFPVDLSVYEISAGGGLWRWVVAVPAGDHAITLPDLSGFPDAHLPGGPVVIGIYGARIDDFDYGSIGYVNLRPQGMDAYSLDFFNALL